MGINFRFDAPIIQVQIVTYIIYWKCAFVWRQLGASYNNKIIKIFQYLVVTQDK